MERRRGGGIPEARRGRWDLGDGIAGGRGGARGEKNRNRGKPQKQLAQNSKATPQLLVFAFMQILFLGLV
jgi:hypothetical protein